MVATNFPTPAVSEVMALAGCRVHFWVWGRPREPVVVLLHGLGLDHCSFAAQIDSFARQYRVVAMDVRGHGQSVPLGVEFSLARAADDVRALLDGLGVDRAVLIGHSMGGVIAQEFGARFRERTRALILVDTLCLSMALHPRERLMLAAVGWILRVLPQAWLVARMTRRISDQAAVRRYAARVSARTGRHTLVSAWSGIATSLGSAGSNRVEVPMLLIAGANDRLGPVREQYARWASRDAGGRYILIPEAGHLPHQDNPVAFNAHVMDFLEWLPAG